MKRRLKLVRPGTLVIGVDASPPPPLHSGHPGDGFEVDLMQALASRLGLTPEYRSARWSEIFRELLTGHLDLICTAATVTEDRRQIVDCSRAYLAVRLAIVVREDAPVRQLQDLEGKPLGVRVATTAEEFLKKWSRAGVLRAFDMNVDAYRALRAREVDAVVDDSPIAAHFSQALPGLRLAGTIEGTEATYAIMFVKGNDELRQAVDQTLIELERDGTYSRLYCRWFGEGAGDNRVQEGTQCALDYASHNEQQFLKDLTEFLAFPSISTDPAHKDDVCGCAQWLADYMQRAGFCRAQIVPTDGHPVVYGEWFGDGSRPTLLIYGHYDVQPPEPFEAWTSPPFQATVRDGRLYARGATDDKGQFFIHLAAIQAYLQSVGELPLNIKLVIEGEEEIGSSHLPRFLKAYREQLSADLAVISDTAFFARDVPSICYGLRGIAFMEVTVQGPKHDLHSGSFGGSIANPIQALSEIIARLRDPDGHVTIPGFYDEVGPPTTEERQAYRCLPWSDEEYAQNLGVRRLCGEEGFSTLERLWIRPTLECNGIWGGFSGDGVKSVLPARASAKISMRLVPNQKPERIAQLFSDYVQSAAPDTVQVSVRCLSTAEPALTPLDSPGIQAAVAALREGFGREPLFQRDGGSIPVVNHLKEILGIETVLLGFGLPDENAHAPDEFLDLGNFFGGIRTVIHFYDQVSRRGIGRRESQGVTGVQDKEER